MDRFHVEINCYTDYLCCEGGNRDKEIKKALLKVIDNLHDLRSGQRSISLIDEDGHKIGYARYERIDY